MWMPVLAFAGQRFRLDRPDPLQKMEHGEYTVLRTLTGAAMTSAGVARRAEASQEVRQGRLRDVEEEDARAAISGARERGKPSGRLCGPAHTLC